MNGQPPAVHEPLSAPADPTSRRRMVVKREKRIFFLCLAALLFLWSGPEARAQNQGPQIKIEIDVKKEVEVLKGGTWTVNHVPVDTVKKGDVLLYTLQYTNEGERPAQNATLVDPIPQGTAYKAESAWGKGAEITFSIDWGKTYQRPPVTYRVEKKDGTVEEVTAPPDTYTHIKWLINGPIPPNGSGDVGFKARVR